MGFSTDPHVRTRWLLSAGALTWMGNRRLPKRIMVGALANPAGVDGGQGEIIVNGLHGRRPVDV